jgi:preprotein translocase subunit SecA
MIKKINRHLSLSLTVGQIKANIRPDHENTAAVDVDRIKSSAHGLIKSAYQLARHRDAPFMRLFETQLLLAVLDEQWREHLSRLEALRHDTQLWANVYQPLTAYKLEAYREFLNLERRVKDRVCFLTFRLMRSDLYAKVLKILQPLGFQAN